MKKLLALVLVLGIASMAQAAFKISVNGVVDPPETEIVLLPSQEVILDIHGSDNDGTPLGFFLLVKGKGSINGSSFVPNPQGAPGGYFSPGYGGEGDLCDYQDAEAFAADVGLPVPDLLAAFGGVQDMSFGNVASSSPAPAPLNGLLVDDIIFHCEGYDPQAGPYDDVIIELWTAGQAGPEVLLDTQVIHQIPEPLSLSLLGLGGMALLRRRR
jgi:hypothetical protein